ncbi:MAG: hypothetical protein JWO46_1610 [Nocardioidaceae bacterium]|nr:hypothetical protein [Nocardioidaceae bacterium]
MSDPYDDEPVERLPVPGDIGTEVSRVVDALPGVARIAAATWWNTTRWSFTAGWKTTRRIFAAATDPDVAAELAHELGVTIGVIGELARQVNAGVPLPKALMDLGRVPETDDRASDRAEVRAEDEAVRLRRRGEQLLERSRDVRRDDRAHPAYERILDDLAPDEARILVFMFRDGPQPSVDVRSGGPLGMVSSRLIAPGLSMIGARSGLRHVDQVPAYLNNLFRLGLVWFSRESLGDPTRYQVLEAQPDVLAAMHSVKMAKVVRRSIHLTPFGEDFCHLVLAPEVAARPEHAPPPEGE